MTVRASSPILFALDLAGTGHFAEFGHIHVPAPEFVAALGAFIADYEPEHRDAALFYAASLAAGRCTVNRPQCAATLNEYLEMRFVIEWRLAIPEAGVIQALFAIRRFQEGEGVPGLFDLALTLSGKPSFQALKQERGEAG